MRASQVMLCALVVSASAVQMSADSERSDAGGDGQIETFVLTPIASEHFSMLVPADVRGPFTNNSCHDMDYAEACYLPARVMQVRSCPQRPELSDVLTAHLSGVLGAWKHGAWPVDGAAVNLLLEQYASLDQLWLTYRLQTREQLGCWWIGASTDEVSRVRRAATQPAAELEIELFGGTHSAPGYPRKVRF